MGLKATLSLYIYIYIILLIRDLYLLILSSLMIKIWTRGQILAQKLTFSKLPQNKWVCSPRRHEPNTIRFVSNEHRKREISRSVRQVKQVKILMLTGQSVRMLTWHFRTMMW